MAAVTVNRVRYAVMGNKRSVLATVTTAATGDTFVSKLKIIDAYSLDANEASTPALSGQVTGGTVTINYGGGGTGVFTIIVHGT